MEQDRATWGPILEGERAARALECVAEIERGIARAASSITMCGLSGGTAGLALFYSTLAQTRGSEEAADRAWELLHLSIEQLAEAPTTSGLYGGYSGVAWVAHSIRESRGGGDGDPLEEIDDALLEDLTAGPWTGSFDLIFGLVGLGVYALQRLPNPTAAACLSEIVGRLRELAEPHEGGLRWLTSPDQPTMRGTLRHYPAGYFDLGVAHGAPGIISLLAGVCAAGIASDRARPLLEGAVRWLLGRRIDDPGGAQFPSRIAPDGTISSARNAWCYGDPGIAAALLVAARSLGEPAWELAAIEIALEAARRAPERSGVVDAGLCHGSAGLAHIFNRFLRATGEPAFREASLYWFDRTLDFPTASRGIAGFQSLLAGDADPSVLAWKDDASFLSGVLGVGLALLAGTGTVEPTWDRLLAITVA